MSKKIQKQKQKQKSSLEQEGEQTGQLPGQLVGQSVCSHRGLSIQEGHPLAGLVLCSHRMEILNTFIFERVSEVQWEPGWILAHAGPPLLWLPWEQGQILCCLILLLSARPSGHCCPLPGSGLELRGSGLGAQPGD